MKRFALLICLLLTFCIVRAEEYLLAGKLGVYPIVLKLSVNGGSVDATYFYRSKLNDIALVGNMVDSFVHIHTPDSSEVMALKEGPNKTWTGKWTNDKGKKYLLVLRPVKINSFKHPYAQLPCVRGYKKGNRYAYVRSSYFKLINDTATQQNGVYKVQGGHLENSELSAIKIISDTGNKAIDKINNVLLDRLIENVEYCKSCISQDTGLSYGYSFNYCIVGNVLSAYVSLSLSCAGDMRMGYSDQTFNYDLKTGKELDLDDILYFPGVKNDKELRGNKVLALLKRLYPAKMVNADYCDYADTLAWQNADWRITENGLLLMPYFVRADLPCWDPDWPVISFDLLKKYRNPNKKSLLP